MAASKPVAVILAGGSGTRFWPASSEALPKQYLRLFGEHSLLQETYHRLAGIFAPSDTFVCSTQSQLPLIREQLPGVATLTEPAARNTGAAVLLCALELVDRGYRLDDVLAIFPADHTIGDTAAFHSALAQACEAAREGDLVLLGITPEGPHTGYGYIEAAELAHGKSLRVRQFVEKPDAHRAQKFLEAGNFFWNSGIFVWTLGTLLEAYRKHATREIDLLAKARTDDSLADAYAFVTQAPVDKMILEKASNTVVVPTVMGWNDIGSWGALWELRQRDKSGNSVQAQASALIDSRGCLVHAPGKQVAVVGISDAVIVVEGDKILVCARSEDQKVRDARAQLQK